LFSSASYIVNKTRSTLDPHPANTLACLWDWCRWHWTFNKLPGGPLEEV